MAFGYGAQSGGGPYVEAGSMGWTSRAILGASAGPSDGGLELGEFTGVIEASRDVVWGDVREFGANFRGGFAGGEITQDQADGNARALQAGLAAEDFWVADDKVFPLDGHGRIIARFWDGKVGAGEDPTCNGGMWGTRIFKQGTEKRDSSLRRLRSE